MKRYLLNLVSVIFSVGLYAQTIIKPVSNNIKSENDRQSKTSKEIKSVIDFNAIDNWVEVGDIADVSISPDGKYFSYGIQRTVTRERDSLVIRSITGSWHKSFEGKHIKPLFFSGDSKQYILKDKDGLLFLQTGSGDCRYIKEIRNYNFPGSSRKSGIYKWLAYQLNNKDVILQDLFTGKEKRFGNVSNYYFHKGDWFVCELNNPNKELLIYSLATEEEKRFPWVNSYLFDESGKVVVLKTIEQANEISTTGLQYVRLANGVLERIWSTSGNTELTHYALDKSGKQIIFIVKGNKDYKTANTIWYWEKGIQNAMLKVNDQTAGIENGLFIQGPASFLDNGKYVRFNLQSQPDLGEPDVDAVKLDVWSYSDTILQSTQQHLSRVSVAYTAVLNLESGEIRQLVKENEELVFIKGEFGVVRKIPTSGDRFWEQDYDRSDYWIVSLKDGSRRFLPTKKIISSLLLSPGGNYLVFFDTVGGGNYFSYHLHSGKLVAMSTGKAWGQLGYKNQFLLTKQKLPKTEWYGPQIIGWIDGESGFVVCDNHDIWQLDPSGKKSPLNITNGYGRLHHTQFFLSNGGGWRYLSTQDTLLLGAFDLQNKFNGFYRKILGSPGNPELLYMGPYFFAEGGMGIKGMTPGMQPLKAANANVWIVQRQTSKEPPNYFLTTNFKNYQQLTNYQPQKKYNWLTTELRKFKQLDGTISQGVLYKPENFDSTKKYPVIIPFYLQKSDQLYQFPTPKYLNTPDFSYLPAWMVSHGYLVFVPDIYFTQSQWGPSTVNTIDGAARYLRTLPYVDGKHLGACGHSNSGRFGAYLFTHSKSFAAMSIGEGAAFANAISHSLSLEGDDSYLENDEQTAFGAGGLGLLWQNKEKWLDHTAVLNVDKAKSPLLIYCATKTSRREATIQLFTALRRLEKPAWWLQYDDGGHVLSQIKDLKDFTLRTTQFYDHYLKESPAPRWMTGGLPYKLKGIEMRYELNALGNCALQKGIDNCEFGLWNGKTKFFVHKVDEKKSRGCNICNAWNLQHKMFPGMFSKEIKDWALDKDIKDALDKAEMARYRSTMVGQVQRIKENNDKLKGTGKGQPY